MAEAMAAEVHRAGNLSAAREKLREILQALAPRKIVAAPGVLLARLAPGEAAQEAGAAFYTEKLRRYAPEADLGVSEMELGIAETGSIAQNATDAASRLVSTLPPVHLAVLRTDTIVPTLRDAITRAGEGGGPPPYWTIITGPSRTADIERVLTIGVHGPYRLIILAIDNADENGNPNG
ncbi:MAG: lactate utilization protein [Armatimonadetes bacterium]|nr:lactate utilization protein [Armatimonadota bacterium]